MKEKIIKWYKLGLWTVTMVEQAVQKGVLSADEAQLIITQQGQ